MITKLIWERTFAASGHKFRYKQKNSQKQSFGFLKEVIYHSEFFHSALCFHAFSNVTPSLQRRHLSLTAETWLRGAEKNRENDKNYKGKNCRVQDVFIQIHFTFFFEKKRTIYIVVKEVYYL